MVELLFELCKQRQNNSYSEKTAPWKISKIASNRLTQCMYSINKSKPSFVRTGMPWTKYSACWVQALVVFENGRQTIIQRVPSSGTRCWKGNTKYFFDCFSWCTDWSANFVPRSSHFGKSLMKGISFWKWLIIKIWEFSMNTSNQVQCVWGLPEEYKLSVIAMQQNKNYFTSSE